MAGQLVRGSLAAILLPFPLLMIVGLCVDWRVAITTAHSLPEAIFQAVTYLPGSILAAPFVAVVAFPAVGAWLILHWRGWARWYVCAAIGLLTGWLNALLWTSNIHDADFYAARLRWDFQVELSAVGVFTGLAVWLIARQRSVPFPATSAKSPGSPPSRG
jgi:hypothetical protein